MKLAMIDSSGVGRCLICSWDWKVPSHRRGKGRGPKTLTLLTKEERIKLLEENLLAHLRYSHDRMLLTKEEQLSKEEGVPGKIYYHGRRPERNL